MAIFIPLVTKFDPKGLQGAQRALANFQNFAVDVGRVAATAIAAVGVASVREAAEFETSFSKIQGLVGLTEEQITKLEEAAMRFGPRFGKSANEAADALFFITSAGLRGQKAAEVLEASLKGAAIGLGDTKTIADLATSAVNAYGESTLGGAEAVDVLAEAVRLGKLAPEELAGSMGMVLPLASNLSVSFAEVGAAMAGMSKTGTDASTAATQLRQILATIAKPTNEADKALARMGLSAEGLRQQIKDEGLFATLETLTDAFDGNIEATTEVFGNIRALSGVLDLMGASVEDNRELFKLMADDTGVLNEAFEITAETAQFKFDAAMATARNSLVSIGEAILENLQPHLDTLIQWMQDNGPAIEEGFIAIFDALDRFITSEILAQIIDRFKEMWPEIKETVFQLGELVDVLAPVLLDAVNDILPLFTDMASVMSDLGFFTDEVIGYFTQWETETPGFVDFLEKNLNPIKRLKETVRGLADALDAARRAYERFQQAGGINQLQGVVDVGSFGGRRAGGGPVASGRGYLVGEMGPELFVPSSGGGTIIPNNQMGGGAKINITVNAGMGANGAQIGEQIVTAIKRYERTSGPVFASA
jgi:TP901 family phage tail tape measure protein